MRCVAVIDPTCFWLFDETEAQTEQALSYLERAMIWLRYVGKDGNQLLVCNRTFDMLEDSGFYPALPHFEKILRRADLSHVITPRQMAALVSVFLSKSKFLEDICPVKDILYSDLELSFDLFCDMRAGNLRSISEHSMASAAIGFAVPNKAIHLVGYAYPRTESNGTTVNVSIGVIEVSPPEITSSLPNPFAVEIKVFAEPPDEWDHRTPEEIWKLAEGPAELKLAIEKKSKQIINVSGNKKIRNFCIGSEFLSSLQSTNAFGAAEYGSVVLLKCAQVVAHAENLEVGYLYTKKGSDKVVMRGLDKAQARRLHITKGKQGLRLMFWESANGQVEFSVVRNKADAQIEAGHPDGCI